MTRGRIAGLAITIALAASCGAAGESSPGSSSSSERRGERSRAVQNGPLGGGEKVSLEDAKARTPYDLPVPPTDEVTGELTGIWISHTQVAFVWATDLTFYVDVTDVDEGRMERQWTHRVEDEAEQGWEMTAVRGHSAIGMDAGGDVRPSSLTWIEDGLSLQFVGPQQSLDELKAMAERIELE